MIQIKKKYSNRACVYSFFQKSIGTLLLLFLLSACSNEDNQPKEGIFKGNVVFSNGTPAKNTNLLIEDQVVGETDSLGSFSVQLEFGTHEVSFITGDVSSLFSSISKTITLNSSTSEIELNNLVLPEPISLRINYQTVSRIHFVWEESKALDFKTFRLYLSESEEFNEEDTRVIASPRYYNSTRISFSLSSLEIGNTYYVRLVVLNEFGPIGGSNVLPIVYLEEFKDPKYKLEQLLSFNPPATPTGIAYDGTHLWISTVKPIGGFYDPDDIKLIKYDYKSGTKLKEFSYSNHIKTKGIAIDSDGRIWMVSDKLKSFDPNTGTITKEFSIPYVLGNYYVRDITFDGQHLALMIDAGTVKRVNPLDGMDDGSSFTWPFKSGWRGIARRGNGDIWALHRYEKRIVVFDADGNPKGSVQVEANLFDADGDPGLYLSFLDDNTLAVTKRDSIILLQVSDL